MSREVQRNLQMPNNTDCWSDRTDSWEKVNTFINPQVHSWVVSQHDLFCLHAFVLSSFTRAVRVNWSLRAQRSCSCSSRSTVNPCSRSSPRQSPPTSPGNTISHLQSVSRLIILNWTQSLFMYFCVVFSELVPAYDSSTFVLVNFRYFF